MKCFSSTVLSTNFLCNRPQRVFQWNIHLGRDLKWRKPRSLPKWSWLRQKQRPSAKKNKWTILRQTCRYEEPFRGHWRTRHPSHILLSFNLWENNSSQNKQQKQYIKTIFFFYSSPNQTTITAFCSHITQV